jgi:hypothetical protein
MGSLHSSAHLLAHFETSLTKLAMLRALVIKSFFEPARESE